MTDLNPHIDDDNELGAKIMTFTKKFEGWTYLILFLLCIPIANYFIGNIGTKCVPQGPCLIPVWWFPVVYAPSGVLFIGLALVLRDLVHRRLGTQYVISAIAIGTILSLYLAHPALAIASMVAFMFSELADLVIYTPLRKNHFIKAVILSGIVGTIVDSMLFLWLAFGSLMFVEGQIIGKLWGLVIALPIMLWIQRKDAERGFIPE